MPNFVTEKYYCRTSERSNCCILLLHARGYDWICLDGQAIYYWRRISDWWHFRHCYPLGAACRNAQRGDAAKVIKNRQNQREQWNSTSCEKGCESSTTPFLQTTRTCAKQGFLNLPSQKLLCWLQPLRVLKTSLSNTRRLLWRNFGAGEKSKLTLIHRWLF